MDSYPSLCNNKPQVSHPAPYQSNGSASPGQKLTNPAGRRLTVLPLVAVTYLMVCGGPYGLDPARSVGDPFSVIRARVDAEPGTE